MARRAQIISSQISSITVQEPASTHITDKLWKRSENIRKEALGTSFITSIRDGSLSPMLFNRHYLQDSAYCGHSAINIIKTAAYTLNNAKNKEDYHLSADFLAIKASSYQESYEEMLKSLLLRGVGNIDLVPVTQSYIDFEDDTMKRITTKGLDPAHAVVSLLPCVTLWKWLGEECLKTMKENNVYRFWAENNAKYDPQKWLDFVNNKYDGKELDTVYEIYDRAMKLEFEFFNWAGKQT